MSDELTYVYALVHAGEALGLDDLAGIGDAPLRALDAEGGLAAVASSVPHADFGQATVDERLGDLTWLAPVARAHDAVVAHCHHRTPTMPLRLATVFTDDASALDHLIARRVPVLRALERAAGCDEWGVRLLAGAAASAADGTAPAATGAAYLQQRRAALRRQEEATERAAAEGERVFADLAAVARAATRRRSADSRPVALAASFLVPRVGGDAFHAELARAADRYGPGLEVTGPWAPYSFAAEDGP